MALLLSAALGSYKDINVAPGFPIPIPIKKRGPHYKADFKTTPALSTDANIDAPVDDNLDDKPDIVIFKNKLPIMVIEVKSSMPVDCCKVRPNDWMEMLIYCHYVLKIYNKVIMLGILSDGKTWHILKLIMKDNRLSVKDYYELTSKDDDVIVGSIPSILNII